MSQLNLTSELLHPSFSCRVLRIALELKSETQPTEQEPAPEKPTGNLAFRTLDLPPSTIDESSLLLRQEMLDPIRREQEWKDKAVRALSDVKDDFLERIRPWLEILARLTCACGKGFNVEDRLHFDANGGAYVMFNCETKRCCRPFHVPNAYLTPEVTSFLVNYTGASSSI